MINMIKTFIKKQFLIDYSYKINFVFQFATIPITFFSFFFLSRIVDTDNNFFQNDNYLLYAIIGVSSLEFSISIMNFISQRLREEQISGVLEEISSYKITYSKYIFMNAFYPAIIAFIKFYFFMIMLSFFGSIDISFKNFLISIPVFLLALLSMTGVSMISSSIIILIKRGNIFNRIFITVSGFCAGIVYPVEVLPVFLQKISLILPTYHLPKALRNIFSNSFSFDDLISSMLAQSFIAFILLLLGYIFVEKAVKFVKKYFALSNF